MQTVSGSPGRIRIGIAADSFGMFEGSPRANLVLVSSDGNAAVSAAMRNTAPFISAVQRPVPSVRFTVDPAMLQGGLEGMVVELREPSGRTREYVIAEVRALGLAGGWAARRGRR